MPERLNFLAHQAAAFAVILLRADASGDGGEHVVFADLGRGAQEVAGDDQLHELLDLDARQDNRRCRLAWRIPGSAGLPACASSAE